MFYRDNFHVDEGQKRILVKKTSLCFDPYIDIINSFFWPEFQPDCRSECVLSNGVGFIKIGPANPKKNDFWVFSPFSSFYMTNYMENVQ